MLVDSTHEDTTLMYQGKLVRVREGARGVAIPPAQTMRSSPPGPPSIVRAGYLHSIPEDPMTGKPDWKVTMGEDPKPAKGPRGVIDVRSSSPTKSSEGTPYSEW